MCASNSSLYYFELLMPSFSYWRVGFTKILPLPPVNFLLFFITVSNSAFDYGL